MKTDYAQPSYSFPPLLPSSNSMLTFKLFVSLARLKISYAFSISENLKSKHTSGYQHTKPLLDSSESFDSPCVTIKPPSILPAAARSSKVGIVCADTSAMEIVTDRDHRRSMCKGTEVPWTPMLAMWPPSPTRSSQSAKVAGMPTASYYGIEP